MPEEPVKKSAKPAVSRGGNVGQRLKSRRQALKISLAQVEIDTKIRGKYLTALEAGDYSKLPNDIYSRGFVQHYGNHLGLDGAALAAEYAAERGGVAAGETKRPKLEQPRRLVLTAPMVTALGALVLIAAVFGYLLWQFSALAGAPQLAVANPASDTSLTGEATQVVGHTTPGADVSIDGSPVLTDTNGSFNQKVALQSGVNAIRIVSQSKLGKTTTITRHVLATLPNTQAIQTFPTTTFGGVALKISANKTVAITTKVDAQNPVEMLVQPGWTGVFQGTNSITLSTSDAGAVSVTVTNSTTAGKMLSPLGPSGEPRLNQTFNSDSTFQ